MDRDNDEIIKLYGKGCRKHKNVLVIHPISKNMISLDDLYKESHDHFLIAINELKPQIAESFMNGKMKRVAKQIDKDFILSWCLDDNTNNNEINDTF